MKHILIFLSLSIAGLNTIYSQDLQQLEKSIDSLFSSEKGDFAIAFRDLSSSENQILKNEGETFHAASTMKTPVMIEVYKQVNAGKFKLSDSILIKNEFISILDGSKYTLDIKRDDGEHLYNLIGGQSSIKDLVVAMIIHSSNLATNIIIELVGAVNVQKTMRELGARDLKVLRGVEDMKAFDAGLNNSVTAFDLMILFEHLGNGTAVNPQADAEMLNILMGQQHRDIIPALLPSHLKIANKTGMIDEVHHDSGIVFLPDGRKYVLVLLSKNLEDMKRGTKMLARVSRLVYDFMENK